MTTVTPLSMWAELAKHGVPREWRGAASMAAMDFFDAHAATSDAAAAEWRRQRIEAFPHAQGRDTLAGRCLSCGDPFPCDGYFRDIDNGEMTP